MSTALDLLLEGAGARPHLHGPESRPSSRFERRAHARRTRRAYADMYSGELRELYRLRGHNPDDPRVRKLVAKGLPPMSGAAAGQGAAAFYLNMPPEGTYAMNPAYFNQETERNDVPQQPFAYTGLGGGRMDQRITNTGILCFVRMIFIGTLTIAGTGTITAGYQWPGNIFKRVTVQANGQTSLIQAEGTDLRARVQRIFRNPFEAVETWNNQGVIANGAHPLAVVYDLPITHDMTTLTGALFAQSDSNYLSYSIEPALASDLFVATGDSTAAITGTIYPQLTYFDIPYIDTDKGRIVAIPDLRWLHGFIASNQPFANTGDVATPLIKNAGQLLALYLYLDNGGAADLDWMSVVDEYRLEYGGNRKPTVWSGPPGGGPMFGLIENERNYNGQIGGPTAVDVNDANGQGPGYLVHDFENDNPQRDLIYPRGLTELQAVAKITAGTTINPNAHVHFVEETLFSGT